MGAFVSEGRPVLLQTITTFEGSGLQNSHPIGLGYTVPRGRTLGMLYFRGGSTVSGMVNITIMRNGRPMRYFPIASGSAIHVSLAIVEEMPENTQIEVYAAGEGSGTLILDIGYLEI